MQPVECCVRILLLVWAGELPHEYCLSRLQRHGQIDSARSKGGAPKRAPPLSLGEMVVPQAKTLGTHKIYFDLSPLIRSRRRQTANYPSLTYWYVAQPAQARIPEQHCFQQSIYSVRNPPRLTSFVPVSIESPDPPQFNFAHHVQRRSPRTPQEARPERPNWYVTFFAHIF
jgi:hypothetical protein